MLRGHQRGFSSQSLGKYWQLNQSNQHTSTYSTIQQQTKNPYYTTIYNEYAQENPRINLQDRRKVTFTGSVYPFSIPVSDHWRLLDPPWGRIAKPLCQPADASTPASLGALCGLFLAPVQEGGWAGQACQGRWSPVALYKVMSRLGDHTEAVS